MTDHTIKSQQNNMYRSRSYDDFTTEFSFLFEKKELSLRDAIHDIITDFSKNIEDIKKRIITTLQSGVDINHTDNEGKTPLVRLFEKAKEKTKYKKDELLKRASFLIERGANIENTDKESQEQPEDKGQKTLIDKFKNLKLFGHSEPITEKDIDSIHQSRHALQEKAKGELDNYIEKGVIKEVSIYGNCAQIQLDNDDDTKEFKISELLNSNFCKDNGISGFSTLHKDGVSGMHGAMHNDIRHYVVTDGSYEMTLKWYAEGEQCNITIKIDADGSVALIEGNGVTWEQLDANKDVKLGNLFLADALEKGRWKDELQQQSNETIRSAELQQGQSGETIISVSRGIEANNSERNVKTSTPNSNGAPLPNFDASLIPFNETSSNQAPAHNLGNLTDDHCEDTGKRTITDNNGSVAVEDVPDAGDNDLRKNQKQTLVNDTANTVAARAQQPALAITYPDGDKNGNTQSSNSLKNDKFASTITSYHSPSPTVNTFKPSQDNQRMKIPPKPPNRTIFPNKSNSSRPEELSTSQQMFVELQSAITNSDDNTQQQRKTTQEDTGKRIITDNNGSVAVVEEVPDAAQAQSYFTYLDDAENSNTQSSNSLKNDKFASTITSYHSPSPTVNTFKPSQDNQRMKIPPKPPNRTIFPNKSNSSRPEELSTSQQMFVGLQSAITNSDDNTQQQRKTTQIDLDDKDQMPSKANLNQEVLSTGVEKITNLTGSTPYDKLQIDSGFSSPIHNGSNESQIDPERLENIKRMLAELTELDYTELSTDENAPISDYQDSEHGEWDHSFDTNKSPYPEDDKEALKPQSKEFGEETFSKGFNQNTLNTGQNAYHKICFLGNNEQVNAIPNQSLEKARNRLKKLGSNGKRSPQTEAHLIEAGLLPASENKQSISEINRETFPVNNGTSKYLNYVTDTYSMIHPLLKKDEEQLQAGVIKDGSKNTEQTSEEVPSVDNYHPLLKQAKKQLKKLDPKEFCISSQTKKYLGDGYWTGRELQKKQGGCVDQGKLKS